jgi:hypothetical protein
MKKYQTQENHSPGAKQAAENTRGRVELKENTPQGLKPVLILLQLRHD